MRFHMPWPKKVGYRRWFAWYPVPLPPYRGEWVWLEFVEREPDPITGGLLGYQYRQPNSSQWEAP